MIFKYSGMYQQTRKQLFLLHFAGGNMYSFNFLKDYISRDFEFIPLELPGRGRRHGEKFLKCKADAVADYVNQIRALRSSGTPYMLYGHSMGATLGYSVARYMESLNDSPELLVVSGNSGPGSNKRTYKRYLLDDIAFKEELKELGGISDEVLESDELYNFFAPVMRADFELLEKDDFSEEHMTISTPISAIMGNEEEGCQDIANWARFSSGQFRSEILSGNHFFIHNHPRVLARIITGSITPAFAG